MQTNSNQSSKSEDPSTPPAQPRHAGPGNAPMPNHTYTHRTWQGDHWEYEYKQEPHPQRHGIGNAHPTEGHSLEIPSHIDPSQNTPEEAYNKTRKHFMTTKGAVSPGIHPKSKQPIEFINKNPAKQDPQGNLASPAKIIARKPLQPGQKKEELAHSSPFGSVASIERWNATHGEESSFTDPTTGQELATVSINIGSVDAKNDKFNPTSRINRRYRVVPQEGSYAYAPNKYIPVATKEMADLIGQRLVTNQVRLNQSKNLPSIPDQMKQGITPRQMLEQGTLPVQPREIKLGKRSKDAIQQLSASFASPEEKNQFINKLGAQVAPILIQAATHAKKYFKADEAALKMRDIGGEDFALIEEAFAAAPDKAVPSNLEIKPDSPLYNALETVTNTYTNGDLNKYTAAIVRQTIKNKLGSKKSAEASGAAELRHEAELDYETAKYQDPITAEEMRQENIDQFGEGSDEEEGSWEAHSLKPWKQKQIQKLEEWSKTPEGSRLARYLKPQILPYLETVNSGDDVAGFHDQLRNIADKVYGDSSIGEEFKNKVIEELGKSIDELVNSTEEWASILLVKAQSNVNSLNTPNHTYSHSTGNEDHPKFHYTDPKGNNIRYTNAPIGHEDYTNLHGDSEIHPNEPLFESNPEFFSPDGRKLTRAPFPGQEIQWNANYHPDDPYNLWAARWVNPITANHEYSYIQSDIAKQPKLQINQQNALLDARLPAYRMYAKQLFYSPQVKDHVTGMLLILIDQARIRPSELVGLSPHDIEFTGDLIRLGDRLIHGDVKINQALTALVLRSDPTGPLFTIPKTNAEGEFDPAFIRRVGSHYLINVCEELGAPVVSFQTYHASQMYSSEMQKLLTIHNVNFEVAHQFALVEIAAEMGINVSEDPNPQIVLAAIQDSLIDPVVFEMIAYIAMKTGVNEGLPTFGKTQYPSIPVVNVDLEDRTPAEQEFSDWLHSHPIHLHAEENLGKSIIEDE